MWAGRGQGAVVWTKIPKFGVGGSLSMANTAYNHKLNRISKKLFILMNPAGAARFCITIRNHGFYNQAKAENFKN